MKGRRKLATEENVPRPLCAVCGKPATCEVTVEVRGLTLECDAGVRAVPYWVPSYRNVRAAIKSVLCEEHVQSSVKVEVKSAAILTSASKKASL